MPLAVRMPLLYAASMSLMWTRWGIRGKPPLLDDGEGVPLAIRDRLFQPFVSTRGKGGLGLGLQTSRRIVERHNGHIRYDDRDGGGSRFSITLPRAAAPAPPPNQAVSSQVDP